MKETVKKIRELLDELESNSTSEEPSFKESFQLFELPEIVASIVDYLQPLLLPNEAVIYWYMFRQSVVRTGDIFVRVSNSELQDKVITSSRSTSQTKRLCDKAVSESLGSLKKKGIITLAGDTNRDGTLYRICLPEEIAICQEVMSKVQQEQLPQIDPKREVDFYNIKENRLKVFERDKYICHYCKKQLTRFSATLDHIQPISQGGDNSYDNLITACLQDNSQRGASPVMDHITRAHKS